VIIELAGVLREDVKVRLRGSTLEISGRRSPPQEQAEARYHRAEISFGDFRRSIELPWEADETKVEARFRDGMLEVQLQRAPGPQQTHIPIQREPAG
jgi:HSP20 family protein